MIDKQAIREFLSALVNKDIPIGDDDSLLVSRLIDSLKITELVVFLEDRYGIVFDADDLTPENFDSLNAIARILEQKGVQ